MLRTFLIFLCLQVTQESFSIPCIEAKLKRGYGYEETVYIPKGFEVEKFLFAGSYGAVFTIQNSHQRFAVKKINLETVLRRASSSLDQTVRSHVLEALVMSYFDSQYLVHGYGYFPEVEGTPPGEYYLVMNLYECDLYEKCKERLVLRQNMRLTIVRSVLRAVHLLHQCGIIHGDIKSENILVSQNGGMEQYALADFGMSLCEIDGEPCRDSYSTYTQEYRPPEVILQGKPQLKSDIWACGCLTSELLKRGYPLGDDKKRLGVLSSIKDTILGTNIREMTHEENCELQTLLKALEAPTIDLFEKFIRSHNIRNVDVHGFWLSDHRKEFKTVLKNALNPEMKPSKRDHLFDIFCGSREERAPETHEELQHFWEDECNRCCWIRDGYQRDIDVILNSIRLDPSCRLSAKEMLQKVDSFLHDPTDFEELGRHIDPGIWEQLKKFREDSDRLELLVKRLKSRYPIEQCLPEVVEFATTKMLKPMFHQVELKLKLFLENKKSA